MRVVGDTIFTLATIIVGWLLLGLKTGWSQGSTPAHPGTRWCSRSRANLRFLVFSHRQVRLPFTADRSIVIAVGNVPVNSSINVFEYWKRCRLLRLSIWSSVFHVMLVFFVA